MWHMLVLTHAYNYTNRICLCQCAASVTGMSSASVYFLCVTVLAQACSLHHCMCFLYAFANVVVCVWSSVFSDEACCCNHQYCVGHRMHD